MERKLIWCLRVFWFMVGFFTAMAIQPSNAQTLTEPDYTRPRFARLDIMRLKLEAEWQEQDRQIKESEEARARSELASDQKAAQFSAEMATLWSMLFQHQQVFYKAKWDEGTVNLAEQLEIKALKAEIEKREKQVREYVKHR